MSKLTACDVCSNTSTVTGWIRVSHKSESWDFCSPWCFHAAGSLLSALLPPPLVDADPPLARLEGQ